MQSITEEMAALLEVTRSLACAIADDEHPLEDIEHVLSQRDASLRNLLSQPLDPSLRTAIQDWIREIQALDADALRQLQQRRHRLASAFSEKRQGMLLTSIYEDNRSLGEG